VSSYHTPEKPKILLLTAGFGEGHNSAALNLKRALDPLARGMYVDPCAMGTPFFNRNLQSFYRGITTHAPWLWKKIYLSTERQDFSKKRLPLMRKPERKLREIIDQSRPQAIVSTYPLYPYFTERIFKRLKYSAPVFTVVTDSIEINAAWRKAPTDYWLVTDQLTRESMIEQGLPDNKIIDIGFPVNPHFADLATIPDNDPLDPFRILYFPTAKKPHVRRVSRELLGSEDDSTTITIVLGRNFRKLYSRAQEIKEQYPGRVTIKAWTSKVPELINHHHLVVGKAGGATVHEALAAACPMLIHHLVPGQEEGNLELLRRFNGGDLADQPGELATQLQSMLANDAARWRSMKKDLTSRARPGAAHCAAQFILDSIQQQNTTG